MSTKKTLFVGLMLVCCVAWACKSPTAPPPPIFATGEQIHLNESVVLDEDLQCETMLGLGHRVKILLEDQGTESTDTGTRLVWVRLRNVTDYDQYLQARAHFTDDTGREVEKPTPWERVFIPANSIETVSLVSKLSDPVTKHYVELRVGR